MAIRSSDFNAIPEETPPAPNPEQDTPQDKPPDTQPPGKGAGVVEAEVAKPRRRNS